MVKTILFVILFYMTIYSCNNHIQCHAQEKAIAYYKNLDKNILRDKIIPCTGMFDYSSVLLNQKSNSIGKLNKRPYCNLSKENFKYLDIITGYDNMDGIAWDEYISDFISN